MKSGFIAVVGRPNVGKSTLMNKIVNEKVAIVSNKAGTTRDSIKGILTIQDCQYVFIDTPGIHKPKHLLGEHMTNTAIAQAQNPMLMAEAMKHAVQAGRMSYLAGRIPKRPYATASSPIDGMIQF